MAEVGDCNSVPPKFSAVEKLLVNLSCLKRFVQSAKFGDEITILGGNLALSGKIKLLSSCNFFCPKFATPCPAYFLTHDAAAYMTAVFTTHVLLQGFPHPLQSAELLLQLVRRLSNNEPTSVDDRSDASHSEMMSSDANDSCSEAASGAVISESSRSGILMTLAQDARRWALQHAYTSNWIQHFQSST